MKFYIILLLSLIGLNQSKVISSVDEAKATVTVNIEIEGSKNGYVYVALHNKLETFPKKGNEAPYMKKVKISGEKTKAVFSKIPYGSYAVSAFYDENGNGKLDYNILGIPKESAGISNNYSGFPKWKKSKFEVMGPSAAQVIKLK